MYTPTGKFGLLVRSPLSIDYVLSYYLDIRKNYFRTVKFLIHFNSIFFKYSSINSVYLYKLFYPCLIVSLLQINYKLDFSFISDIKVYQTSK